MYTHINKRKTCINIPKPHLFTCHKSHTLASTSVYIYRCTYTYQQLLQVYINCKNDLVGVKYSMERREIISSITGVLDYWSFWEKWEKNFPRKC